MSVEPVVRRRAFSEIFPDKIYQRGQIFTWPRTVKEQHFKQYGIKIVVNLWTKIDVDMTDVGLDMYLYLPTGSGEEEMKGSWILQSAELVGKLLQTPEKYAALIVCESGVTRSVFFSALVLHHMGLGLSLEDAGYHVISQLGGHRMKPWMMSYLGIDK